MSTLTFEQIIKGWQAHEQAQSLTALVRVPSMVIEPARSGRCAWCVCDLAADPEHAGPCSGCPRDAVVVLTVYRADGLGPADIALCTAHQDNGAEFIAALIAAGGFQ
ncbi:hypothetical protein [Streptomyces sp. SCSIO ZS0520]|uniref:hypothetical protein n=1 Tax=Streptomyces sp. SCSIO ZS0520 TaxID=2892996 RepID=UPI0021D8EA5B|nr:hypothetical protein [Streptomyces sp. SCSIO ZS0520]